MQNPLLEDHLLPPFSRIQPEHMEPAVRHLIERNKASIDALVADETARDWDSLLAPIEELEDELARCWSPISQLNAVCNSEAVRTAYNKCLAMLSEYTTWLGQHSALCAAYQRVADSPEFPHFDTARQTTVRHALRDFKLAGVSLPAADKQRFGAIRRRLSELGSKFGENVLDATNNWRRTCTAEELAGLPDTALANAAQLAQRAGLDGYLLTLDQPSVLPVLTYCDNRDIRREVYTAHVTRASDQGPDAGRWDNTDLIEEILTLRLEMAQLLGFENYAELSLATKMAQDPEQVLAFLHQLARHSHPQAEQDWQSLCAFAASHAVTDMQPWDVAYYAEKQKQSLFSLSEEDIRPYLPVDRVLPGLFEVARRLFAVDVVEVDEFDSYHPDVRLFEIRAQGAVIARFFLDLYAREDKRGGAWMADCRVRRMGRSGLQLPAAYLVCNFTPPLNDKPSLLTSNELTTLFHEFGHGLHHMLTRQTVSPVSGINGVAWDAVELPSQFLENWCWEREALAFISGHHESGERLPDELLEKMLAARNFQSAMAMARQLEFALFDFRLHLEWKDGETDVQGLLDEVRQQVAVVPTAQFNRFQHSFSHIFAGGYAAGYFSYKWAEVLSADAYSRFEEEGIFNRDTGLDFRRGILEPGGSRDAMALFVEFRGREPKIEPLLRHSGIGTTQAVGS
jgi:oligopeptidase A